jgi:hypothetical protein
VKDPVKFGGPALCLLLVIARSAATKRSRLAWRACPQTCRQSRTQVRPLIWPLGCAAPSIRPRPREAGSRLLRSRPDSAIRGGVPRCCVQLPGRRGRPPCTASAQPPRLRSQALHAASRPPPNLRAVARRCRSSGPRYPTAARASGDPLAPQRWAAHPRGGVFSPTHPSAAHPSPSPRGRNWRGLPVQRAWPVRGNADGKDLRDPPEGQDLSLDVPFLGFPDKEDEAPLAIRTKAHSGRT